MSLTAEQIRSGRRNDRIGTELVLDEAATVHDLENVGDDDLLFVTVEFNTSPGGR